MDDTFYDTIPFVLRRTKKHFLTILVKLFLIPLVTALGIISVKDGIKMATNIAAMAGKPTQPNKQPLLTFLFFLSVTYIPLLFEIELLTGVCSMS